MNSKSSIRRINSEISDPNVIIEAVLYLLPFIAPIIYNTIDKLAKIAHYAMEHGYDIKVKAGPVDIALTKNNL